ncbi:hypothetical protein K0M31_003773 [Melipona bicolor]|uniref:Uncharacterized protein n=1 Tax=Melipona bicolor TaxID=60889 RepID=A0AA40KNX3_9HYME|nr:hypothetical protein K0M31_003773 [Melipona bicolor]
MRYAIPALISTCLGVLNHITNCFHFQSETSSEKANLRELSSELDMSSIEASIENEESLRRIVKRLAPEKNGEYQIYQGS